MNRCLNHIFSYCAIDPPKVKSKKIVTKYNILGKPFLEEAIYNHCPNNYQTCPHILTFTQSLQLSHPR